MSTQRNNKSVNKKSKKNKVEFKYFTKTDNFSKYLIYKNLNKRNNWKPVDNSDNLDLCFVSGYSRVCDGLLSCKKKFIDTDCSKSAVRGDLKISINDYLFTKSIFKLGDKGHLYKMIEKNFGKREYIPLTYDINRKTLNKELFKNNKLFFLKPNEGFERQGQIKSRDYEEVKKQLDKFPNFKNWQLQEFIESYTKLDSFLRSVCLLVVQNNTISLYNSQINEFGSVKLKDGTINQTTARWVYDENGCQAIIPLKKSEYTGSPGIANEVYNKLLGNRYYEKNILPKINKIIKESVLSLGKITNANEKLAFHLFGADLMVDKNLTVKLLEFNIYPTHFANSLVECAPLHIVEKSFGGKKHYDKLIKYESQLLDEIFSVTIDKIYKTNRKVKLKVLKKLI
jgi:hypothetical protein